MCLCLTFSLTKNELIFHSLSTGCASSCIGRCISGSIFQTFCKIYLSIDATNGCSNCSNVIWKRHCPMFIINSYVKWTGDFSILPSSCFWILLWLHTCEDAWVRRVIFTNNIHRGWHAGKISVH